MPEALVSVRYMVNDVQPAIVSGPGGRQILLEDPSGDPIELFGPAAR